MVMEKRILGFTLGLAWQRLWAGRPLLRVHHRFAVLSRQHRNGQHASVSINTVPVPEPSTLALAGLGGLSLLRFRRRNQANSYNNSCNEQNTG
ncbi:MAG: PEP-CTERM sorting domain-containing protein [Verrucomicrobiota bacterium]